MRISVDMGGTFTDLVIQDGEGHFEMCKAPTTPAEPADGIFAALELGAERHDIPVSQLLGECDLFIHATTRAINAVLTGSTGRTAYLATEGHPDTLLFREGGRIEIFNFTVEYPDPYVPRSLTFQIPERIAADGSVVTQLDEEAVIATIAKLRHLEVEAVGVCFLWSTVNSAHEQRVGELLSTHLPGVAFTLSHEINPTLREYRRASSTCIDASLKPVMSRYVEGLESRLRDEGLSGRFVMVTSQGGVTDSQLIADAPIHAINSGPAMAPVAGRHFARVDMNASTAIIADTGGTSFDVSLVRDGRIPWTRETWLGEPYRGHMTGFPSTDIKSIGAGGGSIAWVDEGGMLHVGPRSAGASPGPACYAQGGVDPTVTDAALVLGLLDADFFLGGRMALDIGAARSALLDSVASPLGLELEDAAAAVMNVMTENMVQAIQSITIHQGVDPRSAVLVAGGGAAGLNAVAIARRLGCTDILVPNVGAVLSAAGGLMADLGDDYSATLPTGSADFDFDGVNNILASLDQRCLTFVDTLAAGAVEKRITFFAEARYAHQVWEIEVPLKAPRFDTAQDVEQLVEEFHAQHEAVFAVRDPDSEVEIIHWHARVRCRISDVEEVTVIETSAPGGAGVRRVVFPGFGAVDAAVLDFGTLEAGELRGPAVIESPFTSIAIEPGVRFSRSASGSLHVHLEALAMDGTTALGKSW